MFQNFLRNVCRVGILSKTKRLSCCVTNRQKHSCGMKVTICGAAGCTGQPLSLLLKQCPLIDEIALYDQVATCGIGLELSHVDTKCRVASYSGRHMLCQALDGSEVVVIVARDTLDTFEKNAPVVTEIALQICNMCPKAFVIVATEPVESMVPIVGEILRLRDIYNPRKLLGCVELNCMRANTLLADFVRVPPEAVSVPVVGGATPCTMVPVLSNAVQPCIMTECQVACLTSCIMNGTGAVRDAYESCTVSPCFAGAYAIARTTINVVKGLKGERIKQCVYCDSLGQCAPCCQFFSSEVLLGPGGIEQNLGVPELTPFEHCLLCNTIPYVRNEIARAQCLVYQLCMQCYVCPKPAHPCVCYKKPCIPCVPPVNWTCAWPDPQRDSYIASICRDMTCRCPPCWLMCWHPPDIYANVHKLANTQDKLPITNEEACPQCIPRSFRFEEFQRTGLHCSDDIKKHPCSSLRC